MKYSIHLTQYNSEITFIGEKAAFQSAMVVLNKTHDSLLLLKKRIETNLEDRTNYVISSRIIVIRKVAV